MTNHFDKFQWTGVDTGGFRRDERVARGDIWAGTVHRSGAGGAIITSTNGTDWSAQVSGTVNQLDAVALGGFGFIAVGVNGTLLLSTNGTQWLTGPILTTGELVGVGNGFGKTFVGAAVNAPALFSSTDGTSWRALGGDLFNGNFVYGNGMVLGIAVRGSFYRSLDGSTWTSTLKSPFVYCWGVAFAAEPVCRRGWKFFRSRPDHCHVNQRYQLGDTL